jgi:hypothetical protein
MTPEQEIDPIIAKRLSSLSKVDPRSHQRAIRTRAAFLTQALEMKGKLPVSDSPYQRLKRRIQHIQPLFDFIENRRSLFAGIASVFLVITLVLGGAAITYTAAQKSFPGKPLYAIKIWAEGIQKSLAVSQFYEYELALRFTDRRADEVQRMVDNGQVVDQEFEDRYYQQVEEVIWMAVDQSDAAATPALTEVREHLEKQVELFTRLLEKTPGSTQGALQRIVQKLQERIRECDAGIANPGQLRERLRLIQPQTPPELIETLKSKPGENGVPGPNATATSKPTKTPTPTPTATDTPTPTPTATNTDTPTPAPTATDTDTPTPTPTATDTDTPTPTPTATDTDTPTPTPTATDTDTPTPTSNATDTDTPTPTPNATDTDTRTPTTTDTDTPATTVTVTDTPATTAADPDTPTPTPEPIKERHGLQKTKKVEDPANTNQDPDSQFGPTPKGIKQKPGK